MNKPLLFLLIAGSAAVGWFLRPHFAAGPNVEKFQNSARPAPEAYQCAMHPWVKSAKPARCTICGMELTPVHDGGGGGAVPGGADLITLSQSQIQVVGVRTDEAAVRPLTRTLLVAGAVDDNDSRHRVLSAYVDGRIEKLHVNYVGAEVAAGQPLAEIYSPMLLQAEREYRQLNGPLRDNTALRLRQMGLASGQIAALDRKPSDALTSSILAPIGGTVVARSVFEGQYVGNGQGLFEIADFSVMWFKFDVYEQDLPWIQVGQVVAVALPSLPGRSFEGRISFLDPNFDKTTRSTKARVELENPLVDGRRLLAHGVYAEGRVRVETPAALTIPRSAVIETGREAVVHVDQGGGGYERRVLGLGRRGDDKVEVLAGLRAGEKVVTHGNLLIDGQSEMNRAFLSPPVVGATASGLDDSQRAAVVDFVQMADAMATALSSDDLAAFKHAGAPVLDLTRRMVDGFRPDGGGKEMIEALAGAARFPELPDIKSARRAFHKFTVAATAVLQPRRRTPGMPAFQVWECGMVDEAIPGVPGKARWIQAGDRPGHNPFFGKSMLECASEIKP